MLKKTKSNKYLASISPNFTNPKFISVYNRLFNALEYNNLAFLDQYKINSFETCIDWLNDNNEVKYNTKVRLLDICWKEYITSIDMITDAVVNYYKDFFSNYSKKINLSYDVNTWNNILNAYYIENKSRWNEIVFHTYNLKLFAEKY